MKTLCVAFVLSVGSLNLAIAAQTSAEPLDINTATTGQLRALPGMGEVYARRVIAGRPYTAKNQLATRGVLPLEEYQRIAGLIVAHRVKEAAKP